MSMVSCKVSFPITVSTYLAKLSNATLKLLAGFIFLPFAVNLFSSVASNVLPEIFQGNGRFVELRHFDKNFVKSRRKKGSAGKNVSVFSPRYS